MSTKTSHAALIDAAVKATTADDANKVQELIESFVGARYERPVGDRWNNLGMLTASGSSYDHKVLEVVTNMQDAVVELAALQRFGSEEKVPYRSPHDAAADLFSSMDARELALHGTVTLSDAGHGNKKRITIAARDHGVGLTPRSIPRTIFQVGAGHKDGLDWLQGNFGLGGATTYRNAEAVVVVTRRHPSLLDGEEDRIAVAVVQWERKRTTENAFYLVASPWTEMGDDAPAFSIPASSYAEFEPGTHLALIGYATEGLGRRSGDERSFDTVFNTRLYEPVLPTAYRNSFVRDRVETLVGLRKRLDANPPTSGAEGEDVLPFRHDGTTYHLPIRFRIFAKRGEEGERRNFVAHGHALMITSNGQVHSHWEPSDFKIRTRLKKLYDRVLVVVQSDALPIELRTTLFTADRSQLVRTDSAVRLEREIAAFLDEWPALVDANNALIREAIAGDNNDRPTLEIARKIARALKVKGFSTGPGSGTGGGGPRKPPHPTPPEDLYEDPTHFEGPVEAEAVAGEARGIYLKLNARDGFLPNRAKLRVAADHPEIGQNELTVGELKAGRVRVSIAVPADADLGVYALTIGVGDWQKSSGGLGAKFEWTTKLNVVAEATDRHRVGGPGSGGQKGPGAGDLVALIWKVDDEVDDWDATSVGDVELITGADLAAAKPEYADLAAVQSEIPTIVLNRTYSPLKAYVQARAQELTDEGKEQARERYAVGVGVELLVLHQHQVKEEKAGRGLDEKLLSTAKQAGARGVLSVLPDYDRLAREIEE